jgi:hypothetical protein
MKSQYSDKLEEKEELLHCPTCSRDISNHTPYPAPHRQPRYWIISALLHVIAFITVLACVRALNRPQTVETSQPTPKSGFGTVDHNAHLIGTPLGSFTVTYVLSQFKIRSGICADLSVGTSPSEPPREDPIRVRFS